MERKKWYQKWIFWTILAIILVGVIAIAIIVSAFSKENFETSTNSVKNDVRTQYYTSEEELEKNIKIEAIGITASGDFAFKIKNNNNQDVYISSINVIFKNNDGVFMEKVESDTQYFIVKANSEVVNYAWGYNKDFAQYSKYEFEIELSQDFMEDRFVQKNFEVIENDTGEQIAIEIRNNNDFNVNYLTVMVAYYNDEKIVGCNVGFNMETTKANGTAYMNVAYPEDSKYKKVKFNNYKVYVMSAEME